MFKLSEITALGNGVAHLHKIHSRLRIVLSDDGDGRGVGGREAVRSVSAERTPKGKRRRSSGKGDMYAGYFDVRDGRKKRGNKERAPVRPFFR